MALPRVEPLIVPESLDPGEEGRIEVRATGVDLQGKVEAVITNLRGEEVRVPAEIPVKDVLTINLVDVDNVGFTFTPVPGEPGAFTVKAPG